MPGLYGVGGWREGEGMVCIGGDMRRLPFSHPCGREVSPVFDLHFPND